MRPTKLIVIITILFCLTLVVTAQLPQKNASQPNGARQTKVIGKERLVSVEPLPEDGELCENPAKAPENLIAASSTPANLMAFYQQ